jgi:Mg-chelatase subunit ChlD
MKLPRLFPALLLALAPCVLHSQTAARVTSVLSPQNELRSQLRLHVSCHDQPYYDLTTAHFEFTDNGLPVQNASIVTAASPMTKKPFSAVLVLDCSGSMAGAANASLKTAAHALVNFMDSTDEAAIIIFNSVETVLQGMTSITQILHSAIDQLPASGATAVWDASYAGVQELIANAVNSSQAVVVMTDGGDNSSTRAPIEVTAIANTYNKRVFTIGLGQLVNTAILSNIASQTGGLYYATPSPADLQLIFTTIASFARRDFDEYTIRYDTPDRKATSHTIGMTVRVCDTILTTTATRPSMPSTTGLDADPAASAGSCALFPVSPNPATPGRLICRYAIRETRASADARITLTDVLGRVRSESMRTPSTAGEHHVVLNTEDLAPGLYLLNLRYGTEAHSTRVMIQR